MSDDNKEGAGVPVVCAGKNCGTTTGDHSPECIAEHEAAYSSGAPTPPAVMPAAPSDAVTDAMVDAYLKANDAYWKQTDQLPSPPDKWRTGTPREATRVSLAAALSQTMQPQAERFCNKCGYFGPDLLHQRPNGSGQCGYLSTKAEPAAGEQAGAVSADDPAVRLGVLVMESISRDKLHHVGYLCLNDQWRCNKWPENAEFVPLAEWEENHAYTRTEKVYAEGGAS